MWSKSFPQYTLTSIPVILCIVLYGCNAPQASTPRQPNPLDSFQLSSGLENGQQTASLPLDARPAAIVNGRNVYWRKLRPLLIELSGGQALQEMILDRMLDQALANADITIVNKDIARERKLLADTMSPDPNTAFRLLTELRARQRLGDVRYAALLRRNAALRALVQGQVSTIESNLLRTYDLVYGEKRQVRLITLNSLADARDALDRIRRGEFFGDVAVELSADFSSARGGLLEPVSREDPGYPLSFRDAVWKLPPGGTSNPILLDNLYVLIQLVRVIEKEEMDFEEIRSDLIHLTRLNQERRLMEQLAERLLSNVTIHFIDESLRKSFEAYLRSVQSQE